MIVIETMHHFTFSSHNEPPHFSCAGECKKAWWPGDTIPAIKITDRCPACSGFLQVAIQDFHFGVKRTAFRPLQLADFSGTLPINKKDRATISALLARNVQIDNLSVVKPEFEEKAKAGWAKPDTSHH